MIVDLVRGQLDDALTRYKLRGCASVGGAPRVRGRLWIHGEGRIEVGARVFFDASAAPIEIYPWAGATIVIGDDCYIGGGTSMEATCSITVGARARLHGFCRLMDNHFHPLVGNRHLLPTPRPVVVEDDVELGRNTIVLAGARLGRGARIEAGSVVKRGS